MLSKTDGSLNSNKKTVTSVKSRIKRLAKRSRLIVRCYAWYKFFRGIRAEDLWDLGRRTAKTRLIMKIKPYTLMGYRRLSNLYERASRFEREGISGSFVECGVYKGGSAAVIAAAARDNTSRHVWLFDSWEGFPEPDERDIAFNLERAYKGKISGSEEKVRELLFNQLSLNNDGVHLVKGWFSDTITRSEVGAIALLHLDCDLYESVKYCLEQLYDNVIEGGCIVIDDYGYWSGCKDAFDEFIKNRKLNVELIKVDYQGVCFYKKSINTPSKAG